MAVVKVFMPTYRRNKLLQRSIESLLNQTLSDWVCELHNDDPHDTFPQIYVDSLNDDRIKVINHTTNLGAVATFNLMFDPTECRYISLLEDDNWWEADFLETMCGEMDARPECAVGFSNMFLWQENADNTWTKLPQSLWPDELADYRLIDFPQAKHILNYHHSNCSTIIRNSPGIENYKVPGNIRVDFIEPIKERAYPHPLLFINKPLANFAFTLNTSRANYVKGMYEHHLLLIDSFFTCVKPNDDYAKLLWDEARKSKLHAYLKLIYAGITGKASRKLLTHASLKEWLTFILYNIKYPSVLLRCMNAKKDYNLLWNYLLKNTNNRINEQKIAGDIPV